MQEDTKKSGKSKKAIALKPAPRTSNEKPWWQPHWDDPIRRRERELFAG